MCPSYQKMAHDVVPQLHLSELGTLGHFGEPGFHTISMKDVVFRTSEMGWEQKKTGGNFRKRKANP